jgi:hypothetical protein
VAKPLVPDDHFVPAVPDLTAGRVREQQLPVVIYAVNVSAASLLLTSISWYATRGGRLTAPDLDGGRARHERVQGLAVPAVFLLSIAVSFFSVRAAMYSWLMLLAVDTVIVRRRLAR